MSTAVDSELKKTRNKTQEPWNTKHLPLSDACMHVTSEFVLEFVVKQILFTHIIYRVLALRHNECMLHSSYCICIRSKNNPSDACQ
jgi:hypothetical protein